MRKKTDDEIIKGHNIRTSIGTQNELLAEVKLCMAEARADVVKEVFREIIEATTYHKSHCEECRMDNVEMCISIMENIRKKMIEKRRQVIE